MMQEQTHPTKESPVAVDWVERHACISPGSLAQVDLASDRQFTYFEMNERVGRVSAHLASLGVQPGDRVGFLALNSTDILEIIFGAWRLGAVALALNFRLTAPELAFIIEDAGAKIVIFDDELSQTVDAMRAQLPVEHWIMTRGSGEDSPYELALANAVPILRKTLRQPLSDMCMLMYSSGTTGRPKGVIITHEMMFFAAANITASPGLTSRCGNLATMPLFHIGAINAFACPIVYVGGRNIVQRVFDPGETLKIINNPELGVTHYLGVTAIYNALLSHPDLGSTDFSRLEVAVAGAETIPDALVLAWHVKGVALQEAYGMTETAAGCCLLPKDSIPQKVGSAGKPMLHTDVRVVKGDGQDAAPGELGELWWRGPNVTPGYWNRPQANEEAFFNGWLRSGDIGRIDEDGFIFIEDRLKDLYISGGENVYPAEVENALYDIDGIAEAAVIGVPDPKWGEVGCAFVVPVAGANITLGDIVRGCEARMAKFKIPARLRIVPSLPRNATGKVLKPELRRLYSEEQRHE